MAHHSPCFSLPMTSLSFWRLYIPQFPFPPTYSCEQCHIPATAPSIRPVFTQDPLSLLAFLALTPSYSISPLHAISFLSAALSFSTGHFLYSPLSSMSLSKSVQHIRHLTPSYHYLHWRSLCSSPPALLLNGLLILCSTTCPTLSFHSMAVIPAHHLIPLTFFAHLFECSHHICQLTRPCP